MTNTICEQALIGGAEEMYGMKDLLDISTQ